MRNLNKTKFLSSIFGLIILASSCYSANTFAPIKLATSAAETNPATHNVAGYNFAGTYNAVIATHPNPYLNHNLLPSSDSDKYPTAWTIVHAPKGDGSYQPAQLDMLQSFSGSISSIVPDKNMPWGQVSTALPGVYKSQVPHSGTTQFRNVIHVQQSYSDSQAKTGPIILKREITGLKPGMALLHIGGLGGEFQGKNFS